ncbi:MAG TPA: hypothetical protein VGK23_09320 [Methanomassiliicoccales archaeon]|jgi:hypothetical protein
MTGLSERLSGYWSFALAASAAPLSYLAAAPCGIICGSCPLGGACFVASPLMFGTVIALKFGTSVRWKLQCAIAKLTGNDPPQPPAFIRSQMIEVEDPDDEGEPSPENQDPA